MGESMTRKSAGVASMVMWVALAGAAGIGAGCGVQQPSVQTQLQAKSGAGWVGPDGRIWYAGPAARAGALEEVKQEIQKQFKSDRPTLTHAWVALFEPGGRVWFAVPGSEASGTAMLVGYDGKGWVEHVTGQLAVDRPGRPTGNTGNHVHVNGRSFFSIGNTVHMYDGTSWREYPAAPLPAPVTPAGLSQRGETVLMPAPDGKGLVACTRDHSQLHLLRWNGEGFAAMSVPQAQGVAILSVTAGAKGVWVLTPASLILVPYDGGEAKAVAHRDVQFGAYAAGKIVQMVSDFAGRTYFLLQEMPAAGEPGRAIVIEQSDGTYTAVFGERVNRRCHIGFGTDPEPAVVVPGTGNAIAWLPGNGGSSGPLMLDVREGRVLYEYPLPALARLDGAARGGRIVSNGVVYPIAMPMQQRAVQPLPGVTGNGVVTGAGKLLADVDDRFSVMEEGKWRPLLQEPGLKKRWCRGEGDAVLMYLHDGPGIYQTQRMGLYVDGNMMEAPSFEALVEQHHGLIVKHFGNRALSWEWFNGPWPVMCVNGAGDVFLAEMHKQYRLRVFHDGKWTDINDALQQALKPEVAAVRSVLPAASGSRVYVTLWTRNANAPVSAFARMVDGKWTFEPAPAAAPVVGASPPEPLVGMRDSDGGQWTLVTEEQGRALMHLTEQSTTVRELPIRPGELCAVDGDNCLLLISPDGGRDSVYVVRQGQVTTEAMRVPGVSSTFRRFVEVRPGLLWVATSVGIMELKEKKVGSGEYRVQRIFRPDLHVWNPQSMGLLADGRVAISGVKYAQDNTSRVYTMEGPGK